MVDGQTEGDGSGRQVFLPAGKDDSPQESEQAGAGGL